MTTTRSTLRPRRRPLFTGARVLMDVALFALIVVGLGGVALGRVLPALGYPVYVVAGPSMEPAIPIGAAVILEQVDPAALSVGDVVSLRSGPGRAVFTHRIVRLAERDGERWLETKGDANPAPDPSVTPASAVIGRATLMVPHGGYLLTLLSEPAGVLLILSSGATLMALGWLFESLEFDRRRRRSLATASIAVVREAGASAPSVLSAAMPARTALAISASARATAPSRPMAATAMPARTAVALASARLTETPASRSTAPATLASTLGDPALAIAARPADPARSPRSTGAGRISPDAVGSGRRRLARLRTASPGA